MRVRVVLAVVIVLLIAFAGLGWYVLTRPGPKLPPVSLPPSCTVSTDAGSVTLSPGQIANAATIAAVGIRDAFGEQAIVVALATAMQESRLQNLTGGDRDSVGLFQQRPSQGWGRPDQIADPRFASKQFYNALFRVKGWQNMRVTEAAQRVQRSAYPEAYQQWADQSTVMAAAFVGRTPGALACGRLGQPEARGTAAVQALVSGLHLDWGEPIGIVSATTVTVSPVTVQEGWQYAHWMVAHAGGRDIARVRYSNQEWTADRGTWSTVGSSATNVVAEVFGG